MFVGGHTMVSLDHFNAQSVGVAMYGNKIKILNADSVGVGEVGCDSTTES